MKILSYGHITPTDAFCKECGATFEYTPADVKEHSNRFYTYKYVTCPVCGKWHICGKEAHK